MRRQNAAMSKPREPKVLHGIHDGSMQARIIRRSPLLYELGADAQLDRPRHVRAASSVNWLGAHLAIIQDDASFLALVDPHGASVQAVTLPSAQGVRQFDEARGNKLDKPDFEACFVAQGTLFAFGSGSHARRERVASISHQAGAWAVCERHVPELYRALRAEPDFAGSELNLEGALLLGDKVRFFQRGNGATRDGRRPVNATCDVSLDALLGYLTGSSERVPALCDVVQYELGRIAEVPLTFTDAALHPTRGVVFLACAEASPDAIRDGEVVGTAVGIADADDTLRWGLLLDENGQPSRDKAEGIVLDRTSDERAWIVVDSDDHTRPAELLLVELSDSFNGLLGR